MKIILASASARRREILSRLGLDFEVIVSNADENSEITDPRELVRALALKKAREVAGRLGEGDSESLIIASDTVVFCGGEIFGKPSDRADAARMLRAMSGRSHTVCSGVAVIYGGREAADVSGAEVFFAQMSQSNIEWYLNNAEYADFAGAYAVQEDASLFIDRIEGDYFTIVGLPVRCLCTLLTSEFGIDLPALCRGGMRRDAGTEKTKG